MVKKDIDRSQPAYLREPHPNYIVVFREPSEKNTNLLSKNLNLKEASGISNVRGTTTVLSARNGIHTRVYHQLAVAAAPLTPEEVEELRRDDAVLDVVPNYQRTIPPPQPGDDVPDVLSAPVAVGLDPLTAYLTGMRDALEAALRFQTGGVLAAGTALPPPPAFPIAVPASVLAAAAQHSWCLSLIGIGPNYNRASGKNVVVAVLDTGIDLQHPDFAQFSLQEGVNAVSFVSGESVQDGNGHGSHCAGVIAGPRNSVSGRRFGVAPDVELLVGKVLNNQGSGFDDDIIDAIDWAASQGAQVISMSLGSVRGAGQSAATAYEQIASVLLEGPGDDGGGVLIIAAAGNESARPFNLQPVGNPAACPSIMAVAAVDRSRQVARFSCAELDGIGLLDYCAPGVGVFSTWRDGGFNSISGTSMATPHVAGVAALYRELNPTLSARRIDQLMRSRVLPLAPKRDFGLGLIQAP